MSCGQGPGIKAETSLSHGESPSSSLLSVTSPEEVRMLPDVAKKKKLDGIFPEGQYCGADNPAP